LPASTTPLAGTEVLPIVQSTTTKQVSVANLTAGRAVATGALSVTGAATVSTTLAVTGATTLSSVATTTGTISTTPSGSTDIANKAYVDTVAQGLDTKASVVAGTTANITLSGTQTVDGVVLIAGDRVLVKNQTAPADNGLYLCAAGSWTRTTDMDTWAEVPGAYVFVEQGTTNDNSGWVLTTNNPITLNTTALVFAQFSGAGTYTASNGVLLTGSNFTFDPRTGYGLQTGASGAEIKLATTSGLNLTTDLAVGAGNGISVLTNTVAIDTAVVVRKYAVSVGDGAATSYTVTHNLGTRDVQVTIYDNSGYAEVVADVTHSTTNTITVAFSVAPTSNQYRVVVFG
jgi:phage-related tail fiber protein